MILINASSYVNAEFEAEIGRIPPCMLPIGNKKLLQLQVDVVRQHFPNEKILLSLPEAYTLTLNEKAVIESLPIDVVTIPENLVLAETILYVLNLAIDKSYQHIRIIQGDVFLPQLVDYSDCIGVSDKTRQYDWQQTKKMKENPTDWIGYFAFSSRLELIKALAISKKNFVRAIYLYQQTMPMKSVNIESYYDCSNFVHYIHARANMTTERAFNSLQIREGIVTKSSDDNNKIEAEIYWYTHIPAPLRRFTPQLIDYQQVEGQFSYSLEFLPLLPLNELYVHGLNTTEFWQHIFQLLKEFFSMANQSDVHRHIETGFAKSYAEDLYHKKTLKRLYAYADDADVDLNKAVIYDETMLGSTLEIAQDCIDKALALPNTVSVMHGDLCFSNIMYDMRGRRVKVFDPRGTDSNGNFSIFGNASYDLAKLTHSVIGMYDFIIAGRYEIIDSPSGSNIRFDIDKRLEQIQQEFFAGTWVNGMTTESIMPAVVLLFLSMLPLHADRPDRQRAMLLNAYRLYKMYVMEAVTCS